MTRDELTQWALSNGWRLVDGHPSLLKPGRSEAIVRLVLKATVANVEVKKPAGKWEKMGGAAYGKIEADESTGVPRGLGLVSIPGFSMLMQDNRDRMAFGGDRPKEKAPSAADVFRKLGPG
ncbi:hypothetical protein M0638_18865 [Roseomonas sp. NAR14]|uniref:Uncharacterized protein n=1 Tax=Roseomonas acroporae TaxID=2937791 RepID=A0A9X1YA88_9PROT|nr:hypothetical protein [Roseomonas acroporae]MCK8786441.1 hypothetical protein [Roseomonas acroporae]